MNKSFLEKFLINTTNLLSQNGQFGLRRGYFHWFFKPLTLLQWHLFKHFTLLDYNRQLGINLRTNGVYSLLSIKDQITENPRIRMHLTQIFLALLYGLLFLMPLTEYLRSRLMPDTPFSVSTIVIGMVCGLVISVATGMATGVEASVGFGLFGGLAFGVSLGVAGGITNLSSNNALIGAVIGMFLGGISGLVLSNAYKAYTHLSSFLSGATGGLVLGGITFGLARGIEVSIVLGITFCAAFCFSSGITIGSLGNVSVGILIGLAMSGVSGIAAALLSNAGDEAWQIGLTVALLNIPLALSAYFRLILYPFYAFWSILLNILMRLNIISPDKCYRLSPHVWDELIWLPLPFLDQTLVWLTRTDRKIGIETTARVAASFRQGWAAQRAIESLLVVEMRRINTLPELAGISERLSWLPSLGSQFYQESIEKLGHELTAATKASSRFNKEKCLHRSYDLAIKLQLTLAKTPRRMSVQFGPVFSKWTELIQSELNHLIEIQAELKHIPNPYIPGQPIQANEEAVFTGRRDIFSEIENALSVKYQPPTLMLFGPRRSGKTSLLNQLPQRLPNDIVPVFINLQELAGTVQSASGFSITLAQEIQRQAYKNRNVILQDVNISNFNNLFLSEPYIAFGKWLSATEKSLNGYTLFLTFDEFEWVEMAIDEGHLDEQILSFFRNMIQRGGQPRLALLFAGVHTLDEMKHNWPSYFINVKSVKVGYLPENDARQLITNPIPDFPLDYENDALEDIIYQTRCQPYLLQLVAFEVINYINGYERNLIVDPTVRYTVTVHDSTVAFERALVVGNNYFSEIWISSTNDERLILTDLALID